RKGPSLPCRRATGWLRCIRRNRRGRARARRRPCLRSPRRKSRASAIDARLARVKPPATAEKGQAMNLFGDIRASVIGALEAMQAEGALPAELGLDAVTVEPPRDPAHGDMATNAAMVLAKPARQKPREIAEALAARLAADPRFLSAE